MQPPGTMESNRDSLGSREHLSFQETVETIHGGSTQTGATSGEIVSSSPERLNGKRAKRGKLKPLEAFPCLGGKL